MFYIGGILLGFFWGSLIKMRKDAYKYFEKSVHKCHKMDLVSAVELKVIYELGVIGHKLV